MKQLERYFLDIIHIPSRDFNGKFSYDFKDTFYEKFISSYFPKFLSNIPYNIVQPFLKYNSVIST